MLNKNIDFALIGHNYITFLLSIGLIDRGRKVLVLDDDRFNYGDFFTNSLTQLDVDFLIKWGESNNIGPLINIKSYLTLKPIYFNIGKKQILLGDSVARNLKELARKFPYCFKHFNAEAEYDNEYGIFSQNVANKLYNEKKISKLSSVFESAIPSNLKANFNDLFYAVSHKKNENPLIKAELDSLIYLTRGFFQSRLSTTGTKSEIMHLYFSLISPFYHLDHAKLIDDLKKIHTTRGGDFKKLQFQDLKFNRGTISSFELQSYEGAIRPKKLAFIGGYPVGLPIKLSLNTTSYSNVNVKLEFKSDLPSNLMYQKLVFTSPKKIGTDRPFFEINTFSNSASCNVVLIKRDASKVEFFKEKLLEYLIDDLKFLYPEFLFEIKNVEMEFTLDVFIEDRNYNAFKKNDISIGKKIVNVLQDNAPLIFTRLKNVLYFGPYNDLSLGTFSSLLEIRRWKDSL